MIDAMTLVEVEELCRYWAQYPPLHVIAAALAGGTRRGRPEPHWGVAAVAAELGPGFAVGDVNAGLPAAVLAFEQLRAQSG